MVIKTYKAEPIIGDVEDLTIIFRDQVPGVISYDKAKDDYMRQAIIVVDAILKHAPGGLFDAIFVQMAAYKAGIFSVPHEKDK